MRSGDIRPGVTYRSVRSLRRVLAIAEIPGYGTQVRFEVMTGRNRGLILQCHLWAFAQWARHEVNDGAIAPLQREALS